jgi:asparagine synthase (glutamine-hydrolysing)
MCGIAGIFSRRALQPGVLMRLSAILRHRGPDDEGYFVSGGEQFFLRGDETVGELQHLRHVDSFKESFSLGLVHRRLSIIDITGAGHQPMKEDERGLVIVYNGEVYNYREIKTELEQKGCRFSSESDTEVILNAYKFWGKDCVNRFVGMWAFAIYDPRKKEIFLSRDRFGIKPLYFFHDENLFAFSSEIKAFFEIDGISPAASAKRSFEFISFGSSSDPDKNLFENIQQLRAGYNVVFDCVNGKVKEEKYYELSGSLFNIKENEAEKKFSGLLENSVRLHLRSDVETGSALSGGLDSSSIVALAADMFSPKPFKTFTASYNDKSVDESSYADLVSGSRKNIVAFKTFPSAHSCWKDLDKLIWHQDLPIGSTSMFAQWEVMKAASQQKVKVLLDGQGADEILGGYYNFAGIYLLTQLRKFQISKYFHEKKCLEENFTPAINTAIGRAGFYFLPAFIQKQLRSKERLSFDFISEKYKKEISAVEVPERGGKSFREQSLLSIRFGLQDLLRYEDRNSMAFSIESRVPFLDHRLVEFCLSLPDELKIKNGWTKFILRQNAAKKLPEQVAWRKDKMGFLTPQQAWKSELKNELKEFISGTPVPDFINKNYLLQLCERDISNSSHLSEFWKMISFIKWCQIYKVNFK